MSTIRDRNVLDLTCVEGDKYVLIILDDLKWDFGFRAAHARMLQDKINDYVGYIRSGQANEAKPGLRPLIRILAQYSYSQYCIDFLNRYKDWIISEGDFCDLEWTHDEKYGPFEDGFSDEYVFDMEKIYPRLRKNWAKDPSKEVKLVAIGEGNYPDMPMFRVWDSYIICFMQDSGTTYSYLSYDMLPEGVDLNTLQEKAFSNLSRDITFRYEEAKVYKGVYGILCGGDFEAESLLMDCIWKEMTEMLGDDLVIAVPTKDMVLFTKAGDKKLIKGLMKMAGDLFERNRQETSNLLFSKDIFNYSKSTGELTIDPKRTL